MTTIIRTFAILLALTGLSATSTPVAPTSGGSVHANDGGGLSGAPICTNTLPNCGLDM
jgi:hypothetical protein